MKKKILALILALAMALSLLTGCGSTTVQAAEPTATPEPTEEPTPEPTPEPVEGVTLDSIAQLNGCSVDELNVVYDEDGYISFVGNKLSDEQIKNGEEAIAFVVKDLEKLLDLENVDLSLYSTYTSNKSGVTYYRFQQAIASDVDVETHNGTEVYNDIAAEFLPTGMKLGVDKDGYPVVISSDINHDDLEFDASTLISMEDAEAAVLAENPDAKIHSDYTDFTMWQDESSSRGGTEDSYEGEIRLVYLVYADNDNTDSTSPYLCYVVTATGDAGKIIAVITTDSLGEYAQSVKNTTLTFFDDYEDAGEYTYTINFDWMNENDRAAAIEFFGGDSMEVTVPVMQSTVDGLYYLGDKEHFITMSNYVDAMLNNGNTDMLNMYVTDNPEELSSWHFQNDANEAYGWIYVDDPNYVISSFAEYVKIIYAFDEKFDWFEAYPDDSYLLETYCIDGFALQGMYFNGDPYPTDTSGFEQNASNAGQFYDWSSFQTSPNLGLCLDDVTMSHEFTHGVNSHFTTTLYANEQGAVMEALADMVGYHMAANINENINNWQVGGDTGPVLRNIADPNSKNNPKYKNGIFYVNNADEAILNGGVVDAGGVHINSGVQNYMGYLLDEGETGEGEATLSIEEGLDMWFETLYLTCYYTDFTDIGAYIKYAAEQLEFTTEQQTYISRVLQELGFVDGTVSEELLNSEDSKEYTFHMDYEDEAVRDKYFFSTIFFAEDGNYSMCGGFTDNTDQTVRVAADNNFSYIGLYTQSAEQAAQGQMFSGDVLIETLFDENNFHVKMVNLAEGENLVLGSGENTVYEPQSGIYTIGTDSETGNVSVIFTAPTYIIVVTKTDGTADGEFNLYIVSYGNDEATEEDAQNEATEGTTDTTEPTETTEPAETTENPDATPTPETTATTDSTATES